jgi:nicotinamide riboside transporter PnuC
MEALVFFFALVGPLVLAIVLFNKLSEKSKVWWVGLIIALFVVASWIMALMYLLKHGLA